MADLRMLVSPQQKLSDRNAGFVVDCEREVTLQAEGPVLPQRDNKDAPPPSVPPALPPTSLSAGLAGNTEPERTFVLGEVYKWIKACSILLIFSQILLQTMLGNSDGAMLSRLLGLLVLSSLCSAMLLPTNTNTSNEVNREEDPNTHHWNSSLEDKEFSGSSESSGEIGPPWLPATRNLPMPVPVPMPMDPGGPWLPGGNMTDLRAGPIDPAKPPTPNTAICDMLLNAPVPPPLDQIPLFCICSYCKGTGGPKGDRGDRGPPGM
ncbi:uncharacterized protein LOC120568531 [Perca fluviatilis]|uniref:uncharacterized protein LOC120568531 n=1 Tax=Perca fluviatilis TaxID=8168 RepID=UPI00196379CB|nr:uncharacterized protein LOC120568531 [Perca fluviatilis]